MKWRKKGKIYSPDGSTKWQNNSFLTPQPFLLANDIIRVYGSFRDDEGKGRIGYVDVDAVNPSKIIKVSTTPVLDSGENGMFDDNGVILGDIIRHNNQLYMYYIGFQLVKNVKFLAFTGLAISDDGGNSFKRYQKTPIMDRTDNAMYIRAIHSIMKENGVFRVWYSVGNGWKVINGIPYPEYDIRYTESVDGINFPDKVGKHCLSVNENEYRIGRPKVRRLSNSKLEMRYTFDTLQKEYKAGYAESEDGINWVRMDHVSAITPSKNGWDSEMACYPAIIETKNKTYMFYNGNGMGRDGFGYAELIEE